MNTKKEILIVGAGSAGLSAALFLSESGHKPRIIDKRNEREKVSKALGVNPHTLKLLEQTPITKRFIDNGWKLECMNIWSKGEIIYKNDLRKIKHKYPFILVQPQFETENIIEEELNNRGIFVERGMEVETIQINTNLPTGQAGSNKTIFKNNAEIISDYILGADGNRSCVREAMGIEFQGWPSNEELHLYDIELETDLSTTEGHWFFFKEGAMLMIHIKEGVWRIGGSIPEPLNFLPKGTKPGKIIWETKFKIRENLALKYQKGNVFLLGDAAHIHSPVGGKGMNLCIEDAYIFANLFKEGRQNEFESLRRPEIKYIIETVGKLTNRMAGHNTFANNVRDNIASLKLIFPIVMPRMRAFLMGLK